MIYFLIETPLVLLFSLFFFTFLFFFLNLETKKKESKWPSIPISDLFSFLSVFFFYLNVLNVFLFGRVLSVLWWINTNKVKWLINNIIRILLKLYIFVFIPCKEEKNTTALHSSQVSTVVLN